MKTSAKEAILDTVQGLTRPGIATSFTQKDLADLNVQIKSIQMSPAKIRTVRMKRKISQAIFARVLNVSISSVRQWEQGLRHPTGATQVLLELLERNPDILDYRITSHSTKAHKRDAVSNGK